MKDNWKEYIKKNLKWVVLFICLVGFLALTEDVFNKEIMQGDIICLLYTSDAADE